MEVVLALCLLGTFLPIVWMMRLETRRQSDPRYLRNQGIVIVRASALDEVADVIGHYDGCDIYRYVVFRGMRYDFSRIVPRACKDAVGPRELYLEPGLVYVTG